jgi:hypothetical protein
LRRLNWLWLLPEDQKKKIQLWAKRTDRIPREFTEVYAIALNGQVQRHKWKSIKMIADFLKYRLINKPALDLSRLRRKSLKKKS